MKKFSFDIHYDMVIQDVEVIAETLEEARQMAYDQAARLPMESMECIGKAAIEREQTQTGLQYAEREQARRDNVKDACLCDTQDTDDDPTLTEAEKAASKREQTQTGLQSAEREQARRDNVKRDTLYRLWDAAWQQAKADPEGTRVIVETNEEDPSAPANEFGRYYMIDGSTENSCADHAGQWVVIRIDLAESPFEVHRPNWHSLHNYMDNETQLSCHCENPNNVTRWAARMIDAGRVTDIYADSY